MNKNFSDIAWDDYLYWFSQNDKQTLKRIHLLIKDIERNGNEGIGKPEPLKYEFAGLRSRRITDEHRLIYRIVGDEIDLISMRYHYEK